MPLQVISERVWILCLYSLLLLPLDRFKFIKSRPTLECGITGSNQLKLVINQTRKGIKSLHTKWTWRPQQNWWAPIITINPTLMDVKKSQRVRSHFYTVGYLYLLEIMIFHPSAKFPPGDISAGFQACGGSIISKSHEFHLWLIWFSYALARQFLLKLGKNYLMRSNSLPNCESLCGLNFSRISFSSSQNRAQGKGARWQC